MIKPSVIKLCVIRTWRVALATLLLLAAGNALALGLGQIEVKSRINQPLLAEIPIVSTTPGELQALQAFAEREIVESRRQLEAIADVADKYSRGYGHRCRLALQPGE